MKFTDEELGKQIHNQLITGYDISRISKWAFHVFYTNTRDLTSTQRDVLEELSRMDDDPQFELTEQELHFVAELLITGDKNPIKTLFDSKSKK